MKSKCLKSRRHKIKNAAFLANQTLDHFLFANNCAANANGTKIGTEKLNDTTASSKSSSATRQLRSANWEEVLRINGWDSEFKSIKTLLSYLKSKRIGSEATKKTYCHILYRICNLLQVDPDSILHLQPNVIKEAVDGIIAQMRGRGKSLKYIKNHVDALKTFLKVNKYEWLNNLEIDPPYIPSRYRKVSEYIPTPDEALKIAECAKTLRDKLIILLMAFSGLRISTLLALRYIDVKDELGKGIDNIKIEVYEEMKKVNPNACKGNIRYYTFTIRRATEYLRLYVEERKRIYGGIEDNEPLFTTTYNQIKKEERRWKPLNCRTVQKMVKEASRNAGLLQWRNVTPHSFRKTFQSFLRNQPAYARLDLRDQEFLFGHIMGGSMDNYYDWGKIEELRKKFSVMDPDLKPTKVKQKVVPASELEKYLEDGWVAKFPLQDGRVVIERS